MKDLGDKIGELLREKRKHLADTIAAIDLLLEAEADPAPERDIDPAPEPDGAQALLSGLLAGGARFRVRDDGGLQYQGPPDVMTPEAIDQLRAQKEEVCRLLEEAEAGAKPWVVGRKRAPKLCRLLAPTLAKLPDKRTLGTADLRVMAAAHGHTLNGAQARSLATSLRYRKLIRIVGRGRYAVDRQGIKAYAAEEVSDNG